MKNQKEFEGVIRGLEERGFKIPSFAYEEVSDKTRWYQAVIEGKRIDDLGLYSSLALLLTVGDYGTPTLDQLLSAGVKLELNPSIYFESIYAEDGDDCPIEFWSNLPQQFSEEVNTLKQLENFLPKEDRFVSARKNGREFLGYQTWGRLYGEHVRDGKLKWFNQQGEHFPYVTTSSKTIDNVGRGEGGLYFVSTDIANEPWKEAVVAYHERFCQERGHDYAVQKEMEFAKTLGKEKEHREWRKVIENGVN